MADLVLRKAYTETLKAHNFGTTWNYGLKFWDRPYFNTI